MKFLAIASMASIGAFLISCNSGGGSPAASPSTPAPKAAPPAPNNTSDNNKSGSKTAQNDSDSTEDQAKKPAQAKPNGSNPSGNQYATNPQNERAPGSTTQSTHPNDSAVAKNDSSKISPFSGPVVPQGPPPTPNAAPEPVINGIVGSATPVTFLFSHFLTERSPTTVDQIGDQIIEEIYSDDSLKRPKVFEIQQSIGRLANDKSYDSETKNRVALLQAKLQNRAQRDASDNIVRNGVFVVASSAVIGSLAGSTLWEETPKIIPWLTRQTSEFANASKTRLVSAYANIKDSGAHFVTTIGSVADKETWRAGLNRAGTAVTNVKESSQAAIASAADQVRGAAGQVMSVPSKVRMGVSTVNARIREPADQTAIRSLRALEVEDSQLQYLGDLEPVRKEEVTGVNWKETDLAGLRYAVLNEIDGRPLEEERVIAFEMKRLSLSNPFTKYLLSNEMTAEEANAIADRLATVGGLDNEGRKFVYFFDPKTWTFDPLRVRYSEFKTRMGSLAGKIRPLYQNVNVPAALGTGALTGLVGFTGYYKGRVDDSSERKGFVNLEDMVPTDRGSFQSASE